MSDQNRAFHYAVLASLVLHALVLFGGSQRERPRVAQTEPPIVARLMEPPAPPPAAPAAQPPEPEIVKPRPRPRPKPAVRKPPPRETPLAQSKPAPMSPPVEEPPVAETPAAPEIPAAAPEAPPPQMAGADPAPEPMPDPLALEKYRSQINGAAARYKHYPRVARENNWEGRVGLRMVFAPGGRLESLSVTKTSGYEVLDKQAAEMFRNAAKAVPVPPLLRGKEFSVDVAVAYNLTD